MLKKMLTNERIKRVKLKQSEFSDYIDEYKFGQALESSV